MSAATVKWGRKHWNGMRHRCGDGYFGYAMIHNGKMFCTTCGKIKRD